ncbi:unnamed protein product [Dovyalis caffra]|uniref:Amino acid transporter transmembrane domain-containing protein n=1 Tax=Dovyalis caffra TaxID=77055 RepID=A0AAV1R9S2_9ROSI|nr:unnamed protein product [Dovyalis caffra]
MGFGRREASSSGNLLPREDNPLIAKSDPLSSQSNTFGNVSIAIIGAGVLGLTYAFKRTGWLMGLIMIFSVAGLTNYCMMLNFNLVNSQRLTLLVIWVSLSVVLLGELVHMGLFSFQLGLNALPTLTHLAPLSIFADVVDLAAMGVVIVKDVFTMMENKPEVKAFGGFSVFFYGIGVAVYTFEGVGMVLPIESETKERKKFGRILPVIYGVFGVLGYFASGDDTRDIISGLLVRLVLFINLFLTFPSMMNPVYAMVERRLLCWT